MSVKHLLHVIAAPKRAARSRGFGIHSPFAYSFVREVLTQRYGYYCYPRLDKAARADGMSPAVARALFRLALFFRPASIEVIADGSPAQAVGLALAEGNPSASPGYDTDRRCLAGIGQAARRVTAAWDSAESGMLFSASGLAVFVDSDRLPHQRFDIILPS